MTELKRKAKVREIQVCGGKIVDNLMDACEEYIRCVDGGCDRWKFNFSIELDNGQTKHITFRQEADGIHVYGDFPNMPDALQWAKKVLEVDNDRTG